MSTIRLTRAATLVAATLLAWFTFVAPAYAAEPSLEDAEAAFARAQTAFAAGDFDAAAAGFQEANAIRALPAFQYNTAVCYQQKGKKLGDAAAYKLAIDFYGRYLAMSADAADQAEVGKTVDVLRAEIAKLAAIPAGTEPTAPSEAITGLGDISTRGLVVLESSPGSAAIYLDGRDKGVFAYTPWSGPLPTGKHTLTIEAQGYESTEVVLDAAPDRLIAKSVNLTIAPTLGWLEITSNLDGARVYFDSVDRGVIGVTPLQRNFPAGAHKLIIQADGYDDFEQDIEIVPGQKRVIDAQLAGAPVGYLSISGDGITRATTRIDGEIACEAGPCKKGVREGRRRVTVTRPGYKPYSRNVEIKAGNETTIKVAFAPEPSRLDAIITYVAAAGIAGAGVGLYLHSGSIQDEIDAETLAGNPPADDDPRRDRTKFYKYGAYGAWGVAGITLLTAVYYTFRDKGPPSSGRVDTQQVTPSVKVARGVTAELRPEIGPGYGTMAVALVF